MGLERTLGIRRNQEGLRNEARESDLAPGGIISEELNDAIEYSREALEVYLNQNQAYIRSKLAEFGDFLNEVALEGRSPESTLREILENTLRGAVIQQYKILKRNIGRDTKRLPKNKEQRIQLIKEENEQIANLVKMDINKTIEALLIEFYLALRICQKSNESPSYTRKLLGNLHKVNAGILLRLKRIFKDTVIPLSYLKTAAYSYGDPEGFIRNILNRFEAIKAKYSQRYPYFSDSFLLFICRNKNPEIMLEEYIRRIEEVKKQNPKISYSTLVQLIKENPNDFESRIVQFKRNTIIIEERYPFLIQKAKVVFGKKVLSEKSLISEIEKYLSNCRELEEMFPGIGFYIRNKALFKTKEQLITELNEFTSAWNEVAEDPRIKDDLKGRRSLIAAIYFMYSKKEFLENCLSIQETYVRLYDHFYNVEKDPVFIEINDNFKLDLIRIDYISPNKSFEENVAFFRAKIEKFKSLKQKFGDYVKYGRNPNEGYVSYLLEAIYHSDPEDYLRSNGFEI